MAKHARAVPAIETSIFLIRGQRLLLDSNLAMLYGVATKILVQAVKRNPERLPADFMFRLTFQEVVVLRSQFVTSSSKHGGRRSAPYAFTEQGVAMLSSVLRGPRAVALNIKMMRAFVRLREAISANRELAKKFAGLERKLSTHDRAIADIVEAIRLLMYAPVAQPARKIGFV